MASMKAKRTVTIVTTVHSKARGRPKGSRVQKPSVSSRTPQPGALATGIEPAAAPDQDAPDQAFREISAISVPSQLQQAEGNTVHQGGSEPWHGDNEGKSV